MHVLVIPSWYFGFGSAEITGRMFHQFASALREKNIDARILFAEFNLKQPLKKSIYKNVEIGVPTWRGGQWFVPKLNKTIINGWTKKYVQFINEYIEQEGKPDIIHAQSYLAGLLASTVKKQFGIPFIVTERLSQFATAQIPYRYKSFIAKSFDSADAITCVSPGLKEFVSNYTSNAIEIIPNFYDDSVFNYDADVIKNKTFTFISVGEPSHTKGLDLLIEAYGKIRKANPHEKMLLVLADEIKEKNDLIGFADKYGMAHEIVWKGLVSQMELSDLMRRSHIYISASRTETFGKAIIEAQACGLPVIATKTAGALYILKDREQGLLIDLNNVASLEYAMSEMFKSYETYNSMSIHDAVDKRFSKAIVMEQWVDLYQRFASC